MSDIEHVLLTCQAQVMELLENPRPVYEAANPGSSIDYAVPQGWADEQRRCGFNPQGIVWLYDKENRHGRPFSLYTWAAGQALQLLQNIR